MKPSYTVPNGAGSWTTRDPQTPRQAVLPAKDDEGLVVHLAGRSVGHQTAHEEGGMGANYESNMNGHTKAHTDTCVLTLLKKGI